MPGLSLVCAPAGPRPPVELLLPSLTTHEHFSDYTTTVVIDAPHVGIACTRYPEYPVAVARAEGLVVALEGRVHAPAVSGAQLLALGAHLTRGRDPEAEAVRWLTGVDGDFLLVAADVDCGVTVVLNDRYGRLPVYVGRRAGLTVVSRELRVAADVLGAAELSRPAIAQFLLFGYPLGTTTLFEDVRRLPPASLLRVPDGIPRPLLVHDLERKAALPCTRGALPGELADRIVAACGARRMEGRRSLVSLSGGIDSRLVAGALVRHGDVPYAVTHPDLDGAVRNGDAATAATVASRIGLEWQLYRLTEPTGGAAGRLLRMRCGANYLGMSGVLSFLDQVAAQHGRGVVFFTGDAGDRILGPSTPVAPLTDDDALTEYVLRKQAILPLERVAAAVGEDPGAIRAALREHLRTYPERSPVQKYVHFLLWERALRFMFEGEDRNRCWFWSVTPFYAPDVFELAMAVPDAEKGHHRLRAQVVEALAPRLATVTDVASRGRVDSAAFRWRQRVRTAGRAAVYRVLSPAAERRLREALRPPRGYAANSNLLACLRRQLASCDAIGAYLDRRGVEALMALAPRFPREHFAALFTITSLIEVLAGGATLAEFDRLPLE